MRLRAVVKIFVITLGLGVAGLVPVTPVNAAVTSVGAPTGLSPNGSSAAATPVLSWTRVPDATAYDVEVSTDAFASTEWKLSTVNLHAVPQVALPAGQVQWRVRAKAGYTVKGDWSVGTFTRSMYAAPVPAAPAADTTFQQPDSFPVFEWAAVPGAENYTLQVSTDPGFRDLSLITTYTTKATTYTPTDLPQANSYRWRVMATLGTGINTDWSSPRGYTVLGLRLPDGWTPTSPQDSGDDVNFTQITDAVLDWTPVPGAATYELQVSTDRNFGTTVEYVKGITGTRYARPQTLPNDQYFWRVRPVDAEGNTLKWGDVPVWTFQRNWPDQPELVFPADKSTVGGPMHFEWTPVPHASRYMLRISESPDMSNVLRENKCITTNTTWTPGVFDLPLPPKDRYIPQCWPKAGGTYYWQVTAYDDHTPYPIPPAPPETDSTYGVTKIFRFNYDPQAASPVSPADDAAVAVPTLSWQQVALAEQYKVTITPLAGGAATTLTTTGTSITPRTKLTAGTYRWMVQTISRDGRLSAEQTSDSQRKFTLAPEAGTAATPDPDLTESSSTGGSFSRIPTLHWSSVAGATKYRARIRPVGTLLWTELKDTVQPAEEAWGTAADGTANLLTAQDYEWEVVATTPTGEVVSSRKGLFTIAGPDQISGQRVALSSDSFSTDACAAELPDRCQNLRQTPVLQWDPDPQVSSYLLRISADREWTNLIKEFRVDNTMAAVRHQWEDSQAGQAFFWEVYPCTPASCVATGHADHAFNKLSNPTDSLTPGIAYEAGQSETDIPVVRDDVTLSWRDYLDTNKDAAPGTSTLSTPSTQEARSFEVQVATDPAFSSMIDTREVDQTSYTSFGTTYPEGRIYWRVRALDGDRNPLPWSTVRTFVKRSPVPVLQATPTKVTGSTPLRWQAADFAASYDIEVYKNNDTTGSAKNLEFGVATRQPAFTPPTPWVAGMTYTWRVRRVDAAKRKGGWSAYKSFRAAGQGPELVSPAAGVEVPPREGVLSWKPVPFAKAYRVELRKAGSSQTIESATTRALAHAPTVALPDGTVQWRVTALDGSDAALGDSGWRSFTVRSGPTASTAPGIAGTPSVGVKLTAVAPGWDMPGVTTTYQWLRDGNPINGATSSVYTPVSADYDRPISVRATGDRPGYDPGVATSAAVKIGAGSRIAPSVMPRITGTAKIGNRLAVDPGVWPVTVGFSYQWLRNGTAVPMAIGSGYTLAAADAGKKISVRLTAKARGYTDTPVTTPAVKVRKMASSISAKLKPRKVKVKKRAVVSGVLTVKGVFGPTGKVRIYVGKRAVRTIKLTRAKMGKYSYKLPKRPKGITKVTVKYLGTSTIAPSKRVVKLKVVR